MDPEYEAIVLFISTIKWSTKAISIDRRTLSNTNLTVYIIQFMDWSEDYENRTSPRFGDSQAV